MVSDTYFDLEGALEAARKEAAEWSNEGREDRQGDGV